MRWEHNGLLILLLTITLAGCGGDDGVRPPPTNGQVEERGHAFVYSRPASAPSVTSISLRGSLNNWGETPMTRRSDGSYRVSVELDPGEYEYKFFINGEWPQDMCHDQTWGHANRDYWIDPDADACVPDGHGGQNAVVVIGAGAGVVFNHQPGNPAHVSAAGGRISVRFRARSDRVQTAAVIVGSDTMPMHVQLRSGLDDVWRASIPEGASSYSFTLSTVDGAQTRGPYNVSGNLFRSVPWVGGSIGYQIFPERFWNGDPSNDQLALETDSWHFKDVGGTQPVLTQWTGGEIHESHCCHQYYGGDIQGIRERIGHLEQLGVSLVYLNPIFLAGSAHGYDTFDYLQVAPNFGDEAVLASLLAEAGARGIRMMWDFVPNHVGVGHYAFQDAVNNGPASQYWSWFRFHVAHDQVQVGNGNHYDGWWGLGSLPELQTHVTAVFQHLIDVTRYWTEFGFDGIRVDVPNEIQNRAQFFSAFRQAAKSINPESYLVGEIWERDASWLQGDQFDALMNYAIGQAVIERFVTGAIGASTAQRDMAQLYAEYPEASTAMQFNLISSHDTPRLLTKMGGSSNPGGTAGPVALDRHRLAVAMLYALPGVPVTFQGDECAFVGGPPRDRHRFPMQWQDCDAAMVGYYRQLGELRNQLHAMTTPVIRSHHAEGSLLSFFRGEPGAGEVLAVFNSGGSTQTLQLPPGQWTDSATGLVLAGSADVAPLGWRYLRRN